MRLCESISPCRLVLSSSNISSCASPRRERTRQVRKKQTNLPFILERTTLRLHPEQMSGAIQKPAMHFFPSGPVQRVSGPGAKLTQLHIESEAQEQLSILSNNVYNKSLSWRSRKLLDHDIGRPATIERSRPLQHAICVYHSQRLHQCVSHRNGHSLQITAFPSVSSESAGQMDCACPTSSTVRPLSLRAGKQLF